MSKEFEPTTFKGSFKGFRVQGLICRAAFSKQPYQKVLFIDMFYDSIDHKQRLVLKSVASSCFFMETCLLPEAINPEVPERRCVANRMES